MTRCEHFHSLYRQLSHRRDGRATLLLIAVRLQLLRVRIEAPEQCATRDWASCSFCTGTRELRIQRLRAELNCRPTTPRISELRRIAEKLQRCLANEF